MSYNREALTIGVAGRLKELRENWKSPDGTVIKLSHEELAKKLLDQYGVPIHKDTLKFYEAGPKHSKFENNLGMKLETLYILADFYRVSVDDILGRDPYPLSAEARRNICALCSTPYRDLLNSLLGSKGFAGILNVLSMAQRRMKAMTRDALGGKDTTIERLREIEYEARHLHRDVAQDVERELWSISGLSSLDNAIKVKKKAIREEAQNGEHPED